MFVADGNFKADHVRQKDDNSDVWLLDGAGMVPNQGEYKKFIEEAIERFTVRPVLWHADSAPPRRRPAPDSLLA